MNIVFGAILVGWLIVFCVYIYFDIEQLCEDQLCREPLEELRRDEDLAVSA